MPHGGVVGLDFIEFQALRDVPVYALVMFLCLQARVLSVDPAQAKPENQNVETGRDPLRPEGQRNGDGVDDWRHLAYQSLPIAFFRGEFDPAMR